MWSLTGYCEPSKPLVRASASGERASTSRPGVGSPAYPSPPLGIRIKSASGPMNARARRIYSRQPRRWIRRALQDDSSTRFLRWIRRSRPIALGRDDATREPSLPPHPGKRLGERLAAEAVLPPRKLADGKVHLLLAGARLAEGYAPDLHHRLMEAGALRLASHLAQSQLPRRLAQEDLRPKTPRWPP
jgi:hypothetical protein